MGSAIDLFVSYRFLKLLTTPFEKTEAFKLGIIDKKGHRIMKEKSSKPEGELSTSQQKNAYTILGIDIFPVIHIASNEKIFVSLEDIKDE